MDVRCRLVHHRVVEGIAGVGWCGRFVLRDRVEACGAVTGTRRHRRLADLGSYSGPSTLPSASLPRPSADLASCILSQLSLYLIDVGTVQVSRLLLGVNG